MAHETVANPVGRPIPYDDASEAGTLMFNALTLIHAATELNENGGTFIDPHGLTSNQSMITNLLIQAREQAAGAINKLAL